MPEQLHAPPPAMTGINLARMDGGNAGTSQIGPGDLIEVTIVSGRSDERPTPVPARVAENGTIQVPLIGAVEVMGIEPLEAERRIAMAAVDRGIYRQPNITVKVIDRAVNRVTVLGAVSEPGTVSLPRGSSDLLSALAAAGGLSKEAGSRVDILKHGGHPFATAGNHANLLPQGGVMHASAAIPVSAAAAAQAADTSAVTGPQTLHLDLSQAGASPGGNISLGDRDVVMVLPKEKQVIHVTGLVSKPNQFEFAPEEDVRVLDAIAMAGGTTIPLADKVLVIRRLPDMPEPAVIKVSIAEAKRNGEENMRLAPGDLVSVESTMTTMAVDTVSKFVRFAVGINGRLAAF
jgi:polysaccharide export outer membrane protein